MSHCNSGPLESGSWAEEDGVWRAVLNLLKFSFVIFIDRLRSVTKVLLSNVVQHSHCRGPPHLDFTR